MVEKSLLRPSCNIFGVQRTGRLESLRRQLEAGKFEAGRNGAADERPGSEAASALPTSRRNDGLRGAPPVARSFPKRTWVAR